MREEFEILISIFSESCCMYLHSPSPFSLLIYQSISFLSPAPEIFENSKWKISFQVDGNNHFKCSLGNSVVDSTVFADTFFVSASRRQQIAAAIFNYTIFNFSTINSLKSVIDFN